MGRGGDGFSTCAGLREHHVRLGGQIDAFLRAVAPPATARPTHPAIPVPAGVAPSLFNAVLGSLAAHPWGGGEPGFWPDAGASRHQILMGVAAALPPGEIENEEVLAVLVDDVLGYLVGEGHAYSTVDEDHFHLTGQ